MSADRKPRKSYAEAMSEWAATGEGRGSFQDRTRISLLSPDPFASPVERILGYAWRFGLVALAGGSIYWALLRSHLNSRDFARRFSDQTRTFLRAESADLPKISWRGEIASVRRLTAQGGPQSFFRQLDAGDVSFEVPTSMLWDREWRLRRVSVGSLAIELRSGGLTLAAQTPADPNEEALPNEFPALPVDPISVRVTLDAEAPTPTPKPPSKPGERTALDLRLQKDGFAVAPSFERIGVDALEVARLQLGWGMTEATRGDLQGTSLTAAHAGAGMWDFQLAEATVNQNWLRGLHLNNLGAHLRGSVIEFDETPVRLGSGTGTLGGRVVLGDAPTLDVKLQVVDVPLHTLVGDPFDRVLSVLVSGPLAIGGSTNLSTGVTVRGDLAVTSGSLIGLPILEALAEVTGRIRFREIELSGGKFSLLTRPGRLEVSTIDLLSRSDLVVQGSLNWERDSFDGTLRFGIAPVLLEKVAPAVRTEFFAEESGGKVWLTVPLAGPLGRLTQPTAQALTAAHKRAGSR